MPKIVPPGMLSPRSKGKISGKGKRPKTLRANSTRSMRFRAQDITRAAEAGIISWSDADKATRVYQRITEMMLSEHELKQAGIFDQVPADNAPKETLPPLVLGTHAKHTASVTREPGKDGGSTIEKRTVTVELSGADPRALQVAQGELDEAELAELELALRPLDEV